MSAIESHLNYGATTATDKQEYLNYLFNIPREGLSRKLT